MICKYACDFSFIDNLIVVTFVLVLNLASLWAKILFKCTTVGTVCAQLPLQLYRSI